MILPWNCRCDDGAIENGLVSIVFSTIASSFDGWSDVLLSCLPYGVYSQWY